MEKVNIQEILSSRRRRCGKTLFMGIDGRGGSGKSTLAKLLSGNLKAQIIRTDDFASWENPFDWWPLVIEHVFEPIENGAQTLSYPRSKWWENHDPDPVDDKPVSNTMILEGVGSFRKEFQKYISLQKKRVIR